MCNAIQPKDDTVDHWDSEKHTNQREREREREREGGESLKKNEGNDSEKKVCCGIGEFVKEEKKIFLLSHCGDTFAFALF